MPPPHPAARLLHVCEPGMSHSTRACSQCHLVPAPRPHRQDPRPEGERGRAPPGLAHPMAPVPRHGIFGSLRARRLALAPRSIPRPLPKDSSKMLPSSQDGGTASSRRPAGSPRRAPASGGGCGGSGGGAESLGHPSPVGTTPGGCWGAQGSHRRVLKEPPLCWDPAGCLAAALRCGFSCERGLGQSEATAWGQAERC